MAEAFVHVCVGCIIDVRVYKALGILLVRVVEFWAYYMYTTRGPGMTAELGVTSKGQSVELLMTTC